MTGSRAASAPRSMSMSMSMCVCVCVCRRGFVSRILTHSLTHAPWCHEVHRPATCLRRPRQCPPPPAPIPRSSPSGRCAGSSSPRAAHHECKPPQCLGAHLPGHVVPPRRKEEDSDVSRVHQPAVTSEHSRWAVSRRAERVAFTPCPGVGVGVGRLRCVGPSRRVAKGNRPGREEEYRVHCHLSVAQVLVGTEGFLFPFSRRLLHNCHGGGSLDSPPW